MPVASPAALIRTKDTYREQDKIDRAFLEALLRRSPKEVVDLHMPDDALSGEAGASASTRAVDLESTFRLIQRARSGDQDALDRLLARH